MYKATHHGSGGAAAATQIDDRLWLDALIVAHGECELFVITTPPRSLSPCAVVARIQNVKLTVALALDLSQMADQLGFPWFHLRSMVANAKPSTGTNQEEWLS